MTSEELARLSLLLDAALDLDGAGRERWLASLAGDDARFRDRLRDLLLRPALRETADWLERGVVGTLAEDVPPPHRADEEVGPYRLVRKLGAGGMGEVWLAERTDGLLKRGVALKLPTLALRRDLLVQRFARERDILAALEHAHIARLYDTGLAADGQPYLALEWVQGVPITSFCDTNALDAAARVRLLRQVMDAVQYAHMHLVVHRDLKPSNVLVREDGHAMLLDFGIAKLLQAERGLGEATEMTQVGGRVMTPAYAAPEQVSGGAVSTATDVWALGVLLYELLAGRLPFAARGPGGVEQAVLEDDPPRPAVQRSGAIGRLSRARASDLETIVLKALRKAPAERYVTVQALIDDLDRWQRGEPVLARPASAAYRGARFVARHRVAVAASSLVALTLMSAAAVSLWQANRARSEAARALAVQGFLLDLFRTNSAEQADPELARRTTARQLLDIGAERLAADAGSSDSLRDQPAAKQLLLETLGDLYRQLGLLPEAARLTERRLALARRMHGPADPALARALLDHAAVQDARDRDSATEVMPLLVEAGRVLDAAGDRTSPLRARWHMQLSDHLFSLAPAEALGHAERSVELLRLHEEGRPGLDDALESLANASFRVGDQARGAALMEEAVQAARARGRHDAAIAALLKRAGELHFLQNNRARADPLLREAMRLAERVHGEHGTGTISVRLALARHLAGIGATREARQLAERALADAARPAGQGEPYQMPTVRRMVFEVMLAQGDIAAGRSLLEDAFAEPAALGGDTFEHADLLVDRAIVEIASRQLERARSTMQAAAAMIQRLGLLPRAALPRNLAEVEAEWHLARGDPRAALARLDALQADAGPSAADQRSPGLHARALAAAGSLDRAASVVDQALAVLDAAPDRGQRMWLEAELLQVRGEIRRAAGDCAGALEPLARSALLYAQVHVSTSPRRLEAERALAECRRRVAAPLVSNRAK